MSDIRSEPVGGLSVRPRGPSVTPNVVTGTLVAPSGYPGPQGPPGSGTGGGNVNAAATLTNNQIVLGAGTTNVAALGATGAANTVLHGGTGAPTFAQVNLAAGGDVIGNLPVTNLAGGAGASATTYWRGDGTWQTPPAATGGGAPGGAVGNAQYFLNPTTFGGSTGLTLSVNAITAANMAIGATPATGDIYFRAATGALTQLPVGTAGQILGVGAGLPAWQTPTGVTTSTALVNNQLVLGTAASTVAPLAAGAVGSYLQSNGAGNAPTWVALTAGSGTVTASPQYQLAFYAAAGSVATVQGTPHISENGSRTLINYNAAVTAATFGQAPHLQLNGADGVITTSTALSFGVQSAFVAGMAGGTGGTTTPVPAGGPQLGAFNFAGYDGANVISTGGIRAFSTEANAWTTGTHGTFVDIFTTNTGTTAPTRIIRFGANGGITVPDQTIAGGNMGPGTINTQGLYVNGVPVGSDTVNPTAISAGGNTQGTATVLTTQFNVVTTVNVGTGVMLPAATAGAHCLVRNSGANPLAIYPAGGGQINNLGLNIATTLIANSTMYFEAQSATQWFTVP